MVYASVTRLKPTCFRERPGAARPALFVPVRALLVGAMVGPGASHPTNYIKFNWLHVILSRYPIRHAMPASIRPGPERLRR